jgi:arylsulfatase A-like enzyme
LEEAANHQCYFPARYLSFTEVLRDAGVHVGAHGKTWGPGIARTADGKPRDFGLKKFGDKGADVRQAFRRFLAERQPEQPFFFWFGAGDPHRPYVRDSGVAAGKKPAEIDRVPAYWPDTEIVRRDMLDYAVEVERFDADVGVLLQELEEAGEMENTLVVVTSDHGMPFPRVKGHNYDLSNRVPLVVHWPHGIVVPGTSTTAMISFVDLAPTLLELLQIDGQAAGMADFAGASFTDLFRGVSDRERSFVVLGRERNDVLARPGTPAGLGYPVRGIREGELLYLYNFAPERWPCGDPELGLKDTDDSPTKRLIAQLADSDRYWEFSFGKRPAEELFDLSRDPDCVQNLAGDATLRARKESLREKLFAELKRQSDPRVLGRGDVFDNYPAVKQAADAASSRSQR